MCGIAGVVGETHREVVDRMIDAMRYRGPDDRGLWSARSFPVELGSCRLSILDVSEAGHMPMTSEDGLCVIVYNGEIYNFPELRLKLEQLGHHFRSSTDTEVILAAYLQWGTGCLERLRGMFAFAIFDERPGPDRGTLFLARDRFGIKPLYWWCEGRRFVFASEMKGMLASGYVERNLDPQGVWDYLSLGSVPLPRTMVAGVNSLLPGHAMTVRDGGMKTWRYWDLIEQSKGMDVPGDMPQAARELRSRLENVIRLHMIADVPVGAFLSGGLDSSTIVGLMSKCMTSPLHTFSVGFPGSAKVEDERRSAHLVSQYFGTVHEEVLTTGTEFSKLLDEYIVSLDAPSVDGVNSFLVSRAAARDLKVALSGLGGDELFAGYPQFASFGKAARLLPGGNKALNSILRALGTFVPGRLKQMPIFLTSDPLTRHAIFRVISTETEKRRIASRALLEKRGLLPISEHYSEIIPGLADPISELSYVETRSYMAHTLLRDSDAVSMGQSLEMRVPFLDHELAEFVFALPGGLKQGENAGKLVLRESMKGFLPESVLSRQKVGFDVPMSEWISGPLAIQVRESLSSPEARLLFDEKALKRWSGELDRSGWYQVWGVAVLARWMAWQRMAL